MNFDGVQGNRLRSALESGRFTVLVEASLPEDEIDRKSAADRLGILEKNVLAGHRSLRSLSVHRRFRRFESKLSAPETPMSWIK